MAIKTYKPYTPSRRTMSNLDSSDITAKPKVRSLLVRVAAKAGRNNQGRITSRHKEAGAKKLYRIIDFKRNKFDIQGTVAAIEYDPYRNCRIALVNYADGEKRYIIQPSGVKVGDKVIGSDGKPHNVTGVFPQGIKELYNVTFNDGYSIKCCKEHLWTVQSTNGSKRGSGKELDNRRNKWNFH